VALVMRTSVIPTCCHRSGQATTTQTLDFNLRNFLAPSKTPDYQGIYYVRHSRSFGHHAAASIPAASTSLHLAYRVLGNAHACHLTWTQERMTRQYNVTLNRNLVRVPLKTLPSFLSSRMTRRASWPNLPRMRLYRYFAAENPNTWSQCAKAYCLRCCRLVQS